MQKKSESISIQDDNGSYQDYVREGIRKGCLTLTALGVGIFPSLIILDYFAYPHEIKTLASIRLVTALTFAILHYLFRKDHLISNPFRTAWICLMMASASITALCCLLEGSGCPYYVGVFHVAMAGVLILPCDGRQMGLIMVTVIGIYVLAIWVTESFHIRDSWSFLINVFVLIVTGVICITGSYFTDRMRRESFYRYLAISRSMGVLQSELKDSHGGIEELAHEIVLKKSEIQTALELRNSFISIASHELKTPLTSLQLQMDIGKSKIKNNTLSQSYSEKLVNTFDFQVKRIIRIVDDMLDVSRIESGKFIIEKEYSELGGLVENILSRHFSFNHDIRLIAKESIHGHWDTFKIEQVVINLLNNAIRYGEGKPVTITLKKINNEAQIIVKDQGAGIDQRYHDKIFEKFERGLASKNYGGLGLGLFIAKKIVDAHNGQIEVHSRDGQGSEFIVHLPLNSDFNPTTQVSYNQNHQINQ